MLSMSIYVCETPQKAASVSQLLLLQHITYSLPFNEPSHRPKSIPWGARHATRPHIPAPTDASNTTLCCHLRTGSLPRSWQHHCGESPL